MFKLFPSVCASQIRWKFVPNRWAAHAETAAAKNVSAERHLYSWHCRHNVIVTVHLIQLKNVEQHQVSAGTQD